MTQLQYWYSSIDLNEMGLTPDTHTTAVREERYLKKHTQHALLTVLVRIWNRSRICRPLALHTQNRAPRLKFTPMERLSRRSFLRLAENCSSSAKKPNLMVPSQFGWHPAVFPQFGQPDSTMPQHGFARCNLWTVEGAYDEEDSAGIMLTLALADVKNARGASGQRGESWIAHWRCTSTCNRHPSPPP
jgi:hypothetical protein